MTSRLSLHLMMLALSVCGPLLAHDSWIQPDSALAAGKTVELRIGNGHHFPHSEAVLNQDGLQVFAISPSDARQDLPVTPSGKTLVAEYHVDGPGVYRFYFIQERVLSRTTQGYKPGGRDQHPQALESMKQLRSSVTYALTPGARHLPPKPVGAALEIVGDVRGGTVVLTLWKDSQPCPNAEIHIGRAGNHNHPGEAKTGPDGKLRYELPEGARGPFLFVAHMQERAPEGSNYDKVSYETSLYLDLR